MADNVNHPIHYADTCSLECIEAMEIAFGKEAVRNFCKCNAFKYLWRFKNKNGEEDLKKAEWYLAKATFLCDDFDMQIIELENTLGIKRKILKNEKENNQ